MAEGIKPVVNWGTLLKVYLESKTESANKNKQNEINVIIYFWLRDDIDCYLDFEEPWRQIT